MAKVRWDSEVDLLVAGAGPGGMTAGLVAALEGLDVLICEKSELVGGTGATSAGTLWIPANTQSRDDGYIDSADDATAYLNALIGDGSADVRRATFIAEGPQVIDDLVARTELAFIACGPHPDYRSNLPGASSSGRAIIPEVFDGRLLGRDFARIRPPIREYMLLGGMMVGKIDIAHLLGRWQNVGNFIHTIKLVLRYLADRLRYARGTRLVMGNALVGRLYYSLKKNGVPIHFGTALTQLVKLEGRVAGAEFKTKEGTLRVRAQRGVVLATGGFAHNQEMRRAYMPRPDPIYSMAITENTGDGIQVGKRTGAVLNPPMHGQGGLWTPVSRVVRKDGTEGLYPHIILDRAKPGLIAVNAQGRRFVNEAVSYHDFVEGMFSAHKSSPSIPCHLICDAQFIRKYGLGIIHPGTTDLGRFERNGYVRIAPTLKSLASAINTDAEVLTETILRQNGFAVEGSDPDFGKGDTELNRFNGDPDHRPNPCLGPIETEPFVALEIWPAELACSTGLVTDADARVLDDNSSPIPGLYACGNDMDSIMAGTYPGPGTTLGPALVFAHLAAKHAAKQ